MQNRQGNNNPSFLGMLGDENLSGNGSIHLIPASYVLDIYEYLGFRREKDDILVSRCLLLARYNINCFKFKKTSPSIREYAQQLKYNLQIEKEISIVTDSQKKFQQKWHKINCNCNCYIVLNTHAVLRFFSNFHSYLSHSQCSLFVFSNC